MTEIVFLLAERVHLLDLAGPAQAWSIAADLGMPYRLHYLGEREEISSAQGLPIRSATEWPQLSPADLIVVPGWRSPSRRPMTDPPPRLAFTEPTLDRLRRHHRSGGLVASVCSGAFALGEAGLLDGRRCTTHHDLQDGLAQRFPSATVVRDVLYTADGQVVTSAGIASGIDLTLHLLAVWHGPGFAARVAREMVVFARRNGDEPQDSVVLRRRGHLHDVVHRAQDVIETRFAEPLPLPTLAEQAQVSERTLTRAFDRAIGMSPLRYQQALRVERAELLIGQGSTVEAAARAVGFDDARMLRRLRGRDRGSRGSRAGAGADAGAGSGAGSGGGDDAGHHRR